MLLLLACAEPGPPIAVVSPSAWVPAFAGLDRITAGAAQVVDAAGPDAEVVIEVADDLDGSGVFRVEGGDGAFTVHAGDVLGAQYGVDALLEAYGYRVRHPQDIERPVELEFHGEDLLGVEFSPEIGRRGIHLHTLHPIEGLAAVWGDDGNAGGNTDIAEAEAILDWLVWNRGNYLQWPALDDVTDPGAVQEAWRERTGAIVQAAADRGVEVGMGVQLFGSSNLQLAYDLIDSTGTPEEDDASIRARAETLAGLGLANINLSFGEFSGEDPATFIDRVDRTSAAFADLLPEAELSTVIHVGNYDDLRVEYQGEELLYYFLVDYADPRIVPWVHSVMYYTLFEDAGGAYNHDEFDEHREYLLDRLRNGERAAYFPETAYWIAFDDSVPTWLPLYVRSRWTDLAMIRDEGVTLDEHILFSSGWEWGYWQNDVASLRMSYALPDTAEALWPELLGPGEFAAAAALVTELEHTTLIDARLAPWLSGRDVTMDLGRDLGIIAAPDRPAWDEIVAMSGEDREALRVRVIEGLAWLADGIDAEAAGLTPGDRWEREVVDGVEVTTARARFVAALLDAVLRYAEGNDPTPALTEATAQREAGAVVIARRHADLHDPDPRWTTEWQNATVYDDGYLRHADEQCFWVREEGQVRKLVLGESFSDPGCVF